MSGGERQGMNTDDIKGKLKETGGELTGNERLANEGRADQVKGKVKDAFEDVKDAAEHARDAATRDEPRNP
jgi:uncharacterized protein YjbJ (UPF0337 family)